MVYMARVNRKRLRDLRVARGYTQEDLARASGITLRRLTDLETQSSTNPTLNTLSQIAAALGVSVADLLIDKDI